MNEEKKTVISVNHVSKDYGQGRGNFDVDFQIKDGETLGIVGENGAGKTTLIRQVMGFIKSDTGNINIYNFDAYKDSASTKCYMGYIPGEINFPDVRSGDEFLHDYGRALGMKDADFAYADEIISRMQLDIRAYPKRMSKGMKQKTSIVAAMMLKTPIIIMDEPSIGLDPLMREELLKLILDCIRRHQHRCSSLFLLEELERVCDRVAYMSQGKILDIADVHEIQSRKVRDFKIEFKEARDYQSFIKTRKDILRLQPQYHQVTVRIDKKEMPHLLDQLEKYDLKFISEVKYNLTTYFNERRKALNKEEK